MHPPRHAASTAAAYFAAVLWGVCEVVALARARWRAAGRPRPPGV